jgi:hypothetical protein
LLLWNNKCDSKEFLLVFRFFVQVVCAWA